MRSHITLLFSTAGGGTETTPGPSFGLRPSHSLVVRKFSYLILDGGEELNFIQHRSITLTLLLSEILTWFWIRTSKHTPTRRPVSYQNQRISFDAVLFDSDKLQI